MKEQGPTCFLIHKAPDGSPARCYNMRSVFFLSFITLMILSDLYKQFFIRFHINSFLGSSFLYIFFI
jgi:hypothetical protein